MMRPWIRVLQKRRNYTGSGRGSRPMARPGSTSGLARAVPEGPRHFGVPVEGRARQTPTEPALRRFAVAQGDRRRPGCTGLFTNDLDSVAERLDAAAAQFRGLLRIADVLSLAQARTEKASQAVDLHKHMVGPVGLEPTPYGLEGHCLGRWWSLIVV